MLTQCSSHQTTSLSSPLQLLASSQQEPPHVYIDGAGLQAAVTEAVQAALAPVQQQLAQLQEGQARLLEGQAQLLEMVTRLEVRTENGRRRRQNTRALRVSHRSRVQALEPLAREQPAGADADAAAVGALPPPGTFPQTWRDVNQITHAQLDALAAFYGVEFGVPGSVLRRQAFTNFITTYPLAWMDPGEPLHHTSLDAYV